MIGSLTFNILSAIIMQKCYAFNVYKGADYMIKNVNANVSKLKNENYILAVSSVSTLVFGVAVMIPGLFEVALSGTMIGSTVSCDLICRKVIRKVRK